MTKPDEKYKTKFQEDIMESNLFGWWLHFRNNTKRIIQEVVA